MENSSRLIKTGMYENKLIFILYKYDTSLKTERLVNNLGTVELKY